MRSQAMFIVLCQNRSLMDLSAAGTSFYGHQDKSFDP